MKVLARGRCPSMFDCDVFTSIEADVSRASLLRHAGCRMRTPPAYPRSLLVSSTREVLG